VGVYLLEMMFSDVIEGAGIKMTPRLGDSILRFPSSCWLRYDLLLHDLHLDRR